MEGVAPESHGQGGGSSPRDVDPAPAAAQAKQSGYKDPLEDKLLERLRAFFEENDTKWEPGWRVTVKHRSGGSSAGTTDAYYWGPNGKRYRSRAEIARDYGIAPERAPRGAGGARSKAAPPVLLSREDAWAKATARAAATALPLRLLSGVTVESLGRVTLDPGYITESSLATPGFRSHWTDDNGVTFTSAVLRGASGPLYRVWARRGAAAPPAEGEEEGKDGGDDEEEEDALRGAGLEMGSGSSPDQAWAGVGERQQEVQEIAVMQGGAAGLDPAEALLAAAGPLAGRWGTELYGLSELPALQAAEGLAGVEGSVYRFVEERSSWDEEGRRLAREAARVGKDGAGRGPPSGRKPRADRRPTSQAERDAVTVAKLLDGMIRQLEGGEARSAAAELRARQKQERDMQRLQEKEERRLAKDREREEARKAHEEAKAKEREEALERRRAAQEAEKTFEDTELPGWEAPAPAPGPLGAGRLPAASQPALAEAWQLARRFAPALGLDAAQLPTLAEVEAGLVDGPAASCSASCSASASASASPDGATLLLCSLVSYLVGDLFEATATWVGRASEDVREADLRARARGPHPVAVLPHTWQEAARRYLAALAAAAALWGRAGAGGLPYPLGAVDGFLVLQYLTAGPPLRVATGPAALPEDAAAHAWVGLLAREDAAALAEAHTALAGGAPAPAAAAASARLLRCVLLQLTRVRLSRGGDARLLCFQGQNAASAAKSARPLDLRGVGARVDAGAYAALPRPLEAFAADVRHVCDLHQAAANRAHTAFAAEAADKGAAEVAALVAAALDAALEEVGRVGGEAYVRVHAPPAAAAEAAPDAAEAAPDGAEAAGAAAAEGRHEDDAAARGALDLGRPFAPWAGCCVTCWGDEDAERLLTCQGCGCACHCYCADPQRDEPPQQGGWRCGPCAAAAGASGAADEGADRVQFARNSGAEALWALSQELASREWAEWAPARRADLLAALCALTADSLPVHDVLLNEEDQGRELRKALLAKRADLKQRQHEEAERAAAAAAGAATGAPAAAAAEGAPPEEPRHAPRRGRDPAAETEALKQRISKLEADLADIPPARLDPLGLDRHHNRYWALPAGALCGGRGDNPAAVLVERCRPAGDDRPAEPGWQVGLYSSAEQVDALVAWLNVKGKREKSLAAAIDTARVKHEILVQDQLALTGAARAPAPAPEGGSRGEGEGEGQVAAPSPAERLRASLLDLADGFKREQWDPSLGSAERMGAWRAAVAAAAAPSDFMASLVELEGAVGADQLKPHWRPWASPAPRPSQARTLAAVWLRLEAFKSAVKLRLKLSLGARGAGAGAGVGAAPKSAKQEDAAPRGGGKGGKRAAAAAAAAADSSGGEGSRGGGAAKRPRRRAGSAGEGTDDEDDEAMARRLQSELNAGGTRGTRSRLRTVHTAGQGQGHGHGQGQGQEQEQGQGPGEGRRAGLRESGGRRGYQEASESEGDMDWQAEQDEGGGGGGGGGTARKRKKKADDSEAEYDAAADSADE